MKKLISLFVIALFGAVAYSHEFWIQPKKFKYKVGEEMFIRFLVGENFEGIPWDLKKNKVEKLDLHHLAKVIDLRNQIKPDEKEKLKFKFTEVGTHLLSMQSNEAFIEMEASQFNDYLKDEGLDDILDLRAKTNTLDKPSKEIYYRYAKLLVQSGEKTDDTYKKKVGQKLEIIPQQNPYNLKSGDYLTCTVFFDGKPAPHQMIKVWNKIGDNSILQNAFTENDGTVKFPISSKGPWMLCTVKMMESKKPNAQWESFWGSLAFGIE